MLSLKEARDVAEEYFNAGTNEPSDAVGIFAFAEGYVAWTGPAEPEDPTVLPVVVGGGCIVIDKPTGEVAIRPLLDPESVADNYLRRAYTWMTDDGC